MTPIETFVYDLVEQVVSTGDPALREMGKAIVTHAMSYLKAAGSKQAKTESLSLSFDEFLIYRGHDGGTG